MKRVATYLLVFAMIASMTMNAFAASADTASQENNTQFNISETVDEHHRVVRVFERNTSDTNQAQRRASTSNSYEETKKLLLALGMEQSFIDNLSNEDLEAYATSPKIVATIAYTKTDAVDDVTYLDEEDAIQGAEAVLAASTNKVMSGQSQAARILAQDTYQDSYMRVFYCVAYLGNGNYSFSTDARWLTMPYFRGTDSIGSCAQNGTVTDRTRNGYYEYDSTETKNDGNPVKRSYHTVMNSGSFKNAINGNFYGSAAVISLPNDTYSSQFSMVYSNYKFHYEYTGHVNYPTMPSYFNTTGTYDHSTITIGFSPSVAIDLKGPSGSIGLNTKSKTDTRSVNLEINYNPNA